jgi:hypothetical protein
MKYIILEDRIYDLIMKHIENMFNVDNINWIYGTDDYGDEVDYVALFYLGDFGDDENLFRWYDEGYWEIDELDYKNDKDLTKLIGQSPILSFDNDGKKEQLDNLFGDRWHQPFKDWFQKNFNLPIKTIE